MSPLEERAAQEAREMLIDRLAKIEEACATIQGLCAEIRHYLRTRERQVVTQEEEQ